MNPTPTNPSTIHRNILAIESRINALNIAALKPYSPYLYVGNIDSSLGSKVLPELIRLIPFGKRYLMYSSYSVIEFNTNTEALEECNALQNLNLYGRKLILNVLRNEQVNQFLLPPLEDIDNSGKQGQGTKLGPVKKPETDVDSTSTVSPGSNLKNQTEAAVKDNNL